MIYHVHGYGSAIHTYVAFHRQARSSSEIAMVPAANSLSDFNAMGHSLLSNFEVRYHVTGM